MAKIVVRYHQETLKEVTLVPGFNSVGRLSHHSISIEHLGISRNHAFILGDRSQTTFVLEDLGSMNGTYVNKKRIAKYMLQPNDVITIGQHTLEFVLQTDPANPHHLTGQEPRVEEIHSGRSFVLFKEVNFFGNSSADDVHIPGIMVGKNFACINRKGNQWTINQLVKRFATVKLNGNEVMTAVLSNQDVVEIGGTQFRFLLPGR